jgi:hypothetical protein
LSTISEKRAFLVGDAFVTEQEQVGHINFNFSLHSKLAGDL